MEKIKCHKCGSEGYTSSPDSVKCHCERDDFHYYNEYNPELYLERLKLISLGD